MNDEQLLSEELRVIDKAIAAIQAAAYAHGMQEENYDSVWMNTLEQMRRQFQHRIDDCYRTRRAMFELAVPARSH